MGIELAEKIVKLGSTLEDIMRAVNVPTAGFCFVVNDSQQFVGVVTDGDLRRWLLAGMNLSDTPTKSDVGESAFHRQSDPEEKALARLNKRIRVLPVLDDQDQVIDYYSFDERTHVPVASPELSGNEMHYLLDAFRSTWVSSSGKYLDLFEKRFSEFIGCDHGVATSNGTTALTLALAALDVGPGDEVIVPDLTFAATINSVLHVNAKPVIVDIEPDHMGMDPIKLKEAITPRTKAVIPVHIYGQPCKILEIKKICQEHGIFIVEDAAEAHGAQVGSNKVGTFSDISCFSFFGNKIVTTGEGGMCLTNSDDLAKKMRVLRAHGMSTKRKYWHDLVGYNFRMTNLQAAIGCAQMERIDEILDARLKLETRYRDALKGVEQIEFMPDVKGHPRVVWLVSAFLKGWDREAFSEYLIDHGIDVRPFFYPLSSMPIYKEFSNGTYEVSHQLARIGLNFPTHSRVDTGRIQGLVEEFRSRA